MPNINLKDKNGDIVTYNGINKIQIQNASGGNALFVNASGAITITSNGSYDVTTYQNAIVNIEGASNLTTVAVPLAIEERTILPDGDFDGFSEIFVQGLEGSVNIVDSEGNEVEIESMEIDNGIVNILISGITNEIDEFLENTIIEYTNDRVTKLGNSKFCTNQSLVTVNFANVEEVGDRCFSGCAKLANVNMPKVKTVMGYAFNSTLITGDSPIFQSIETFGGNNAFWSCSNLGDVNMPNIVTGIAQNTFNGSGLTSFRADNLICATTANAGSTAFSGCTKLEYVHFDKLQIVGTQWFNGCKALKKAEFNSVTTFRGYAFQGCSALETLIIRTPDVVATIDSNMFYSITFTGIVYVPDELVEQYKVATNWSVYAEQIKPLSEYVEE